MEDDPLQKADESSAPSAEAPLLNTTNSGDLLLTYYQSSWQDKIARLTHPSRQIPFWLPPLLIAFCMIGLLPISPAPHRPSRQDVANPSASPPLQQPQPTVVPGPGIIPPIIAAPAAFVMDTATGQEWGSNADEERPMASTTKIMTAMVALLFGRPNQSITIGADVRRIEGQDASRMCCPHIQVGQRYTLAELLDGLMLPSGDDAAIAIADGVAGSQAAFVALMNHTSAWLGLTHTHYMNPHGLDDDNHFTTARDLAHLTAAALAIPGFRALVAQHTVTLAAKAGHPVLHLTNTNVALGQAGVDGVKTGYTGQAGYCVVLHAGTLIAVVLGDPDDATRFADGMALLRWAGDG